MAMFNWSGIYINPQDVDAIYTNRDNRQDYPFYMKVHLRSGEEYRVNYRTGDTRDADAERLAKLVNRLQPDPVSRYEVEGLLDRLKNAIRRDIKALRAEIKELRPNIPEGQNVETD